jgi:DNA-binding transcriptional ArsR family regulator
VKDRDLLFRALADPTRRVVFESLRNGAKSVGELARGLPVSRPAVSQHLRALKEAGLVRERRIGTRHYYEIDPRGLEPLRLYMVDFWGEVLEAFKDRAEHTKGGRDER